MYNSQEIRSGSLKATYCLPSVSSTLMPVFSIPAFSRAAVTRRNSPSSSQTKAK